MEETMYLYKIENLLNGKVYIGITNDVDRRKYEHRNNTKNTIIGKAIKKYGAENFTFEILEKFNSLEDANEAEIEAIKRYDSHVKTGHGYNVTFGGDGIKLTMKQRRDLLKGTRVEYRPIWVYDIDGVFIGNFNSTSETAKELGLYSGTVSNVINGKRLKYANYIMFTEEPSREDIDLKIELVKSRPSRSVKKRVRGVDIKTGKTTNIFDSAEGVIEWLGKGNKSLIQSCCRGDKKSAYGYKWEYISTHRL